MEIILIVCMLSYVVTTTIVVMTYLDAKAKLAAVSLECNDYLNKCYQAAATIEKSHNNLVTLVAEHDKKLETLKQTTEFARAPRK